MSKLQDALSELAALFEYGALEASTNPVSFLRRVCDAVSASKPVFSDVKPTKPGAYWWRGTAMSVKYLALVSEGRMGLWIPMFCPSYMPWDELYLDYPQCQFSGPLPEPEET